MKKFALATAAAAALMFAAPSFTGLSATPAEAQTVVKKKVVIKHGDRGRHEGWRHRNAKSVVIHRDRGRHEGWRHSRHHGASKTVIIKKKGNGNTVIKKKIVTKRACSLAPAPRRAIHIWTSRQTSSATRTNTTNASTMMR